MGWVAKLVANLLVTSSSLGSDPDIPQKSKTIRGLHKQKSDKHTLARKIFLNKNNSKCCFHSFIHSSIKKIKKRI